MVRSRERVCRSFLTVLLCLVALAGSGCGFLAPYPVRMAYAQAAFADGDLAEAVRAISATKPPEREELLHHMEIGSLLHAKGDFEGSNRHLLAATDIARAYDDRAVLSLRDSAALGASLLVNDNLLPYRGAPFERVMVHCLLAVNFLMQKDLDSARVEILRAHTVQKATEEAHEEAIRRTREEARRRALPTDDVIEMVRRARPDERDVLQMAGNLYVNAFALYLSSIVYEMNGELDEAYIDARAVYELNPDFVPVRRDLLRLSSALGFRSDLERWQDLFGAQEDVGVPPDHGEVLVLHEAGQIGRREEIKVPIPVTIEGWPCAVTVAIPVHRPRAATSGRVSLRIRGKEVARTFPLTDLDATAARYLWDEAPAMATRQIIRAAGRLALILSARRKYGEFASSILSLLFYATEQADLRSWMSLPRELQVARTDVPAGTHEMEVVIGGGAEETRVSLGTVPVRARGTTIILLRSLRNRGTGYCVVY